MRWNTPRALPTSVEATFGARPIKIAYLIPVDDLDHAQLILDAVFFESYTRWAGVRTLVVPMQDDWFQNKDFGNWIREFDADFIYAYSNSSTALIEEIDRLCSPIAFLAHAGNDCEAPSLWRTYLPRWGHYFKPLGSVSTARSPYLLRNSRHDGYQSELTVFTQYSGSLTNRTLADNFGVSFDLHSVMHEVPGLYRTLCLTPLDLPENHIAGSERCASVEEALRAIGDRRVATVSQLAFIHGDAVGTGQAGAWTSSFHIFVGGSPSDRINFWNCRSLCAGSNLTQVAMSLDQSFFTEASLLKELGHYLNKNNFVRHGNGPSSVALHSSELSKESLEEFAALLRDHTWNSVSVPSAVNKSVVPTARDLDNAFPVLAATSSQRLTEDFNHIRAEEPEHLSYLDPRLKSVGRGQWIVEAAVERHHSLSKYSNVVDVWELPAKTGVARAFTEGLARPTRKGRLALLPVSRESMFGLRLGSEPYHFDLSLPSDREFFRYLSMDFHKYPSMDVRASLAKTGYANISVSDKGQNLRGVIAMFGKLSIAYDVLANAYWRKVFARAREGIARPRTFTFDQLRSIAWADTEALARVAKIGNFRDIGEAKKYLKSGLSDTLERLVRAKVFFQVFYWRCGYCGHTNSKMFDEMRIRNECSICSKEYLAPIDIEWSFELNEFVYRSLELHSGRPVLWTLGYLLERTFNGSFWFLPEVDLHLNHHGHEKNEVDALCMVGGKFYAIEVKRTAAIFLNVEGAVEKFCAIVDRLRPDVAMLSFERYCGEDGDEADVRARLEAVAADIRGRISPWSSLEILVAQDVDGFDDLPYDLGWGGRRVQSLVVEKSA